MGILPSESPVPHDSERAANQVALLERLKKRFALFADATIRTAQALSGVHS